MTNNQFSFEAEKDDFPSLFPNRLHRVLSLVERHGLQHVVSWLPCGTAFKVHDVKTFEQQVLPKIGRLSRYKSFLRQLNIYKFKRIQSASSLKNGSYEHPYFKKGHEDLCRGVLRGEEIGSIAKQERRRQKKARNKVIDSVSTQATPLFSGGITPSAFGGDRRMLASLSVALERTKDDTDHFRRRDSTSSIVSTEESVPDESSYYFSSLLGFLPDRPTQDVPQFTQESCTKALQPPSHTLGAEEVMEVSISFDCPGNYKIPCDLSSADAFCTSDIIYPANSWAPGSSSGDGKSGGDNTNTIWSAKTEQETVVYEQCDDILDEIITTFCW